MAMAIAELTAGIIYSDDGAWEYRCFPATAEEFRGNYLDLSKIQDDNLKDFVERCLCELRK